MADFRIETERLTLREWREDDLEAFHTICADPAVMEFLGPVPSRDEVAAAIVRQQAHHARLGYCYWALEERKSATLIGFCGLQPLPQDIPAIGGKVDIGWRMAKEFWGRGLALEAAKAALCQGFDKHGLHEIWAITVPANRRSWGLMERLGMERQPELDFDHPSVPEGSALKLHGAWCMTEAKWNSR